MYKEQNKILINNSHYRVLAHLVQRMCVREQWKVNIAILRTILFFFFNIQKLWCVGILRMLVCL